MGQTTVVVASRDESLNSHLRTMLTSRGLMVEVLSQPSAASSVLSGSNSPDLLIIGISLEDSAESLLLARNVRSHGAPPIIVIASGSSEELAIAALRAGVADYFKMPLDREELLGSISRHVANSRNQRKSDESQSALGGQAEMIGESPAMREIRAYLFKVGATDSNALITGETGTGKELAAAVIHNHSSRRHKPFIQINCAAIPDTLLESELFGYERGAFTGANSLKEGMLKIAEGGSVFFDEIGDMSPYAQAKILRAIESREIRRLGGKSPLPLNIRIIAATNHDLSSFTADGRFRSDLYFRLSVARIHLPPLRSRMEDLACLSQYYVGQMNDRTGRAVKGFTPEAFAALLAHDWPGNVRELKNLIEAAFIDRPVDWISPSGLPEHFRTRLTVATPSSQDERTRILSALFATNWNKSQAAQQLRWSRMTLYRKMTRYQLRNNSTLRRTGNATNTNNV